MIPINLSESRILITNDDGYSSEGINLLANIAKKLSNDVWIIAPEFEMSGASHALTFTEDLNLKVQGDQIYSINGTPSDCVAIGLDFLSKDKRPNLVLSGVNSGCNVGEDVTYSGTIAAAMEGIMRKVPSIAISQNYEQGKKNNISWDCTNYYLENILKDICSKGWKEDTILNLNFPYCNANEAKDIQITTQGNRESDDLIIYEKEKNIFRFGLQRRVMENGSQKGLTVNKSIPGFMTDVQAIAKKHVSITPLHIDLTHTESLFDLKNSLNSK